MMVDRAESCVLKARAILAWANAPGDPTHASGGLKARAKRRWQYQSIRDTGFCTQYALSGSIPTISFVERHAILGKHRPHFGLKVPPLVMKGLAIDVLHQCRAIAQTNRERGIPTLPTESRKLRSPGLDPLRRGHLQPFHQLRNRLRAAQIERNVNMIRSTAYTNANVVRAVQDGSHIGMHFVTNRIVQRRSSILRAEDEMHQHVGERLRHGGEYNAGLQPAAVSNRSDLGRCPRLG